MKKVLKSIAVVTLVIFCLASCKKNEKGQTTLEKVQGSWLLQNVVDNNHYSGSDHITTSTGAPSDYFDFRTDGKIYFSVLGYKDTVTYSVPSDGKLLIDGTELYDIKTLTSNSFIVYKKEIVSSSDYDEETIAWKK